MNDAEKIALCSLVVQALAGLGGIAAGGLLLVWKHRREDRKAEREHAAAMARIHRSKE